MHICGRCAVFHPLGQKEPLWLGRLDGHPGLDHGLWPECDHAGGSRRESHGLSHAPDPAESVLNDKQPEPGFSAQGVLTAVIVITSMLLTGTSSIGLLSSFPFQHSLASS